MSRHQYSGDALIEVLHTAQELYGFLSPERLKTIAHKLRLPPSRVLGVASFYHFFSLEPKGEHTMVVCLGTACYVAGALGLVEVLQTRASGDQRIGKVSVQTARCIGSCGLAPAVICDGKILARVTKQSLGRASWTGSVDMTIEELNQTQADETGAPAGAEEPHSIAARPPVASPAALKVCDKPSPRRSRRRAARARWRCAAPDAWACAAADRWCWRRPAARSTAMSRLRTRRPWRARTLSTGALWRIAISICEAPFFTRQTAHRAGQQRARGSGKTHGLHRGRRLPVAGASAHRDEAPRGDRRRSRRADCAGAAARAIPPV